MDTERRCEENDCIPQYHGSRTGKGDIYNRFRTPGESRNGRLKPLLASQHDDSPVSPHDNSRADGAPGQERITIDCKFMILVMLGGTVLARVGHYSPFTSDGCEAETRTETGTLAADGRFSPVGLRWKVLV